MLVGAALSSLLVALAIMPHTSVAAELQWRRGRAPGEQARGSAGIRRDAAVRPAAWGDAPGTDLPWHGGRSSQAALRSIVIDRDEPGGPVLRMAQTSQPAGEAGAGADADTDADAEATSDQTRDEIEFYLEQMRTRFGTEDDGQSGVATPDAARPFEIETTPLPAKQDMFQPGDTGRPLDDSLIITPTDELPTDFGDLTRDETGDAERQLAESICSQELADLKASTLADVGLDIAVVGTPGEDYPFECSIDDGTWHAGRSWPQTVYMWKASALCHKPLYFEDEAMERYGHSWGPCCDPIVSGVHFFSRLPILPYCMGDQPPCECVYALGHYRPGSCAPYLIDPVPISARGALFQAGAVVGAAAILP